MEGVEDGGRAYIMSTMHGHLTLSRTDDVFELVVSAGADGGAVLAKGTAEEATFALACSYYFAQS